MKIAQYLTGIGASLLLAGGAHAAVTYTNDFEADTTNAGLDVTSMHDYNGTQWHAWSNAAPGFSGNLTTINLAIGPLGWAYQSVGSLDAGTTALDWSMHVGGETGQDPDAEVIFWAGSFGSAADGTDIAGAGLTQVVSIPIAGAGAESPISGQVDVSAFAPGTEIWLEIDSTDTNSQWIGIDNIAVTGVPEPSTAVLGGLGLLALLRRRRA